MKGSQWNGKSHQNGHALFIAWIDYEAFPGSSYTSCDKRNPKTIKNHQKQFSLPKTSKHHRKSTDPELFTQISTDFYRTHSSPCGTSRRSDAAAGRWGNGHVHRAKLGIKVQQEFLQRLQAISRLGGWNLGHPVVPIVVLGVIENIVKHGPKTTTSSWSSMTWINDHQSISESSTDDFDVPVDMLRCLVAMSAMYAMTTTGNIPTNAVPGTDSCMVPRWFCTLRWCIANRACGDGRA